MNATSQAASATVARSTKRRPSKDNGSTSSVPCGTAKPKRPSTRSSSGAAVGNAAASPASSVRAACSTARKAVPPARKAGKQPSALPRSSTASTTGLHAPKAKSKSPSAAVATPAKQSIMSPTGGSVTTQPTPLRGSVSRDLVPMVPSPSAGRGSLPSPETASPTRRVPLPIATVRAMDTSATEKASLSQPDVGSAAAPQPTLPSTLLCPQLLQRQVAEVPSPRKVHAPLAHDKVELPQMMRVESSVDRHTRSRGGRAASRVHEETECDDGDTDSIYDSHGEDEEEEEEEDGDTDEADDDVDGSDDDDDDDDDDTEDEDDDTEDEDDDDDDDDDDEDGEGGANSKDGDDDDARTRPECYGAPPQLNSTRSALTPRRKRSASGKRAQLPAAGREPPASLRLTVKISREGDRNVKVLHIRRDTRFNRFVREVMLRFNYKKPSDFDMYVIDTTGDPVDIDVEDDFRRVSRPFWAQATQHWRDQERLHLSGPPENSNASSKRRFSSSACTIPTQNGRWASSSTQAGRDAEAGSGTVLPMMNLTTPCASILASCRQQSRGSGSDLGRAATGSRDTLPPISSGRSPPTGPSLAHADAAAEGVVMRLFVRDAGARGPAPHTSRADFHNPQPMGVGSTGRPPSESAVRHAMGAAPLPQQQLQPKASSSRFDVVLMQSSSGFDRTISLMAPTSSLRSANSLLDTQQRSQRRPSPHCSNGASMLDSNALAFNAELSVSHVGRSTVAESDGRPSDGEEEFGGELHWTKMGVLGKGSFGTVYEGITRKGKIMAVKVQELPFLMGQDESGPSSADESNAVKNARKEVKALETEINLMRSLVHPNIVAYYGCQVKVKENNNRQMEIFLEHCHGGSLASLRQKFDRTGEKFRISLVRSYTKQVLEGLAYLHGQNVVHRDIKSDNVLIGADGSAKLADFGCSKQMGSNSIAALSGDAAGGQQSRGMYQTVVGSPFFMAPEVMMGGEGGSGYSMAADIWSVGCLVIELLGRQPWSLTVPAPANGDGAAAGDHGKVRTMNIFQLMYHISKSKEMPTGVPRHCPPDLLDFFQRCFERDPAKRATAAELLRHRWITCPDQKLDEVPPDS